MTHPSWQPWQPWQGNSAPQPWSGSNAPSMLASHADRERAVDVLRAGFGEGRLAQPEFEQRVTRAYTARTVGELALLVADLPQGPMPHPAPVTPVPGTFLASPARQTNSKAVGSAVCGVLCLVSFGLTGIPAVVLGHAARTEIRRTGQSGDALALTGLVLGWLSTAAWVVLLTLLMVAAALSESGAG
ncbi:DUF1707 and DUF4190 domain-containing protein [Streptomyces sp. NPDC098781]|uniref:DUF1707 and DUF4190 domain-containing protein n=1 Tax=Streptomyces sp. NPDC098781 TaxID=3366097 RepID=UPI003815FBE1